MKISQAFKDIEKPQDVDQAELKAYLQDIYRNENHTEQDVSYVVNDDPVAAEAYKQRANALVDKLVSLSGNNKFNDLRVHFNKNITKGHLRNIVDEIKKTAETICFKMERKLIELPEKFKAEIRSSTIHACEPGALTNMQDILYNMDDSLFYSKYAYIQRLALEYIREKKMASIGNEVHKANELIHEVSRDCKVLPPKDTYANYRNLDEIPGTRFEVHAAFKAYLEQHLSTRKGVYSLASHIANDSLRMLPEAKAGEQFPFKEVKDKNIIDSEQFKKITAAADKSAISLNDLIKASDSYTEFEYKPGYQSIITAATMQQLLDQKLLQMEQLRVDDFPIIESEDGWYIFDRTQNKISLKDKLLDITILKGLNINGQDLEDALHNQLKGPLENKIGFNDALRAIIEQNENKIELESEDILKELWLISDQARSLLPMLSPEELREVDRSSFNRWLKFQELQQQNPGGLLNYIAKEGDALMLEKYLTLNKKSYNYLRSVWMDINGNTLLFQAATSNNINLISYLGDKKIIGINAKNNDGMTALHYAAISGKVKAMEALIKHGADINAKANDGRTALHYAASFGKVEAMEALMKLGADKNANANDGRTALHLVAYFGQVKEMEALINHGADINVKDSYGHTALYLAAISGEVKAMEALIEHGADINAKANDGRTVLHLAADSGEVKAKEALIEHGADINAKDYNGWTALHLAAYSGQVKAMEALMKLGADKNANANDGRTALHLAAYSGQVKAMEALMKHGADINAKDNDGRTALHLAADSGKVKAMEALIKHGADINAKDNDGYTVLHLAANSGTVRAMEAMEEMEEMEAYYNNPVDYLLEAHKNNPTAFIRAISNLEKSGYDFNQHQSPDRFWDLDSEKITQFLNQEIADRKTTNFRKIIKSGDQKLFELALSFEPDITASDAKLINNFYPDVKLLVEFSSARKIKVFEELPDEKGYQPDIGNKLPMLNRAFAIASDMGSKFMAQVHGAGSAKPTSPAKKDNNNLIK
jgi:ankyrin repeat protein